MRASHSFHIVAVCAAILAAGCGQNGGSATPGSGSSGPREIDLTAGDAMKYNITSLEAKPGEALKVVLTNIGTVPKEVMGHNWVLLKAGVDAAKFDAEASAAKPTDYFPPDREGDIIARIELLGPRKSGEVVFKAPDVPGEYTFLCTFPAHFQAGMHGTLTVK